MKKCMQNKKSVESTQIERITPFRFASFPPMVRLRNAYKYIMCASPSKARQVGLGDHAGTFERSNKIFTFHKSPDIM